MDEVNRSSFNKMPEVKGGTSATVKQSTREVQSLGPGLRPAAPPVYRPQPAPRCVQSKAALPSRTPMVLQTKAAHATTAGNVKTKPAAPPLYRPLPMPKVLQRKETPTAQQRAVQLRNNLPVKTAAPAPYNTRTRGVAAGKATIQPMLGGLGLIVGGVGAAMFTTAAAPIIGSALVVGAVGALADSCLAPRQRRRDAGPLERHDDPRPKAGAKKKKDPPPPPPPPPPPAKKSRKKRGGGGGGGGGGGAPVDDLSIEELMPQRRAAKARYDALLEHHNARAGLRHRGQVPPGDSYNGQKHVWMNQHEGRRAYENREGRLPEMQGIHRVGYTEHYCGLSGGSQHGRMIFPDMDVQASGHTIEKWYTHGGTHGIGGEFWAAWDGHRWWRWVDGDIAEYTGHNDAAPARLSQRDYELLTRSDGFTGLRAEPIVDDLRPH